MVEKPTYEELEQQIRNLERENNAILQAHRKMEESEKLHRITLENISDTVLITDDQGKIVYVCPNTNIIFGLSQSEVYRLGTIRNLLNGMVFDLSDLKSKNEITNIEWSIRDKSGHEHFLLINIKSVKIKSGTVLYVMRDITDRQQAKAELEKNRSILSEAEKLAGLGGWEWDIINDAWTMSENWLRIHGCSNPHLATSELMTIAYPEDIPKIEQAFAESAEHGSPYKIEHRIVRQDTGEIRYVQAYGEVRLNASGKAVKMFGAAQDITKRKQAEVERENLRAQLNQAQKMEALGTLAGGIAHDFNNLLMGVQGRTSLMMLDKDRSYSSFKHLQEIENCIQKAARLTKQLLGFARGGKYEIKPTDLNDLVENCVQLFGRTRKNITIFKKYEENLLSAAVDQSQIEQVLLNIFINAWQAMPKGGNLYVETKNEILYENFVRAYGVTPGKYIKISIRDTGIGMDEKTMNRVFDPFFTTKEKERGTGFGLASAYGIIKNHDGIIAVESAKDKGTTFHVYLPASDKPVIEEQMDEHIISAGSETVLVVDDEATIIDVSVQMLKELGYKVLPAHNGKEAIEIFKQNTDKVAIVILDLIMPGMGGGEVYERLKEIDPTVKVLLSSGYSINGQVAEILNRGCDGFIQKPFKLNELSFKLREIISK
ncbi:MAG: PAS domain S-box protein [Desulfobacterales bacterium]|jgi:PAS domain S-box-containing protein